MRFRIRFADQIVGVFIIVALAAIIFVVFMLGSKQRWFVKDPTFKTYFQSGAGLGENMAVIYKGFTIGNIKSFKLTEDDEVEVVFSIYNEYDSRVREGSLVDLNVSPIGLGNQFLFYPGLGEEVVAEGAYIPTVSSPQGQTFIQLNISSVPAKNDSISNILSQVDTLTRELNVVLTEVEKAVVGTDTSSLGRTLGGVETLITGLPGTIDTTLGTVTGVITVLQSELTKLLADVQPLLAGVQPILSDVNALTSKLNEPDGLVYSALDTEGPVYTSLVSALDSVTGILKDLDSTTDLLPAQIPGLLLDVRSALKMVNDLLVSLENNPLLKKGIPTQVQTQSSGTNPRDVGF
jgi:phospholipid/cholesterol/gamma-HCH transport system substrate-binding protein